MGFYWSLSFKVFPSNSWYELLIASCKTYFHSGQNPVFFTTTVTQRTGKKGSIISQRFENGEGQVIGVQITSIDSLSNLYPNPLSVVLHFQLIQIGYPKESARIFTVPLTKNY